MTFNFNQLRLKGILVLALSFAYFFSSAQDECLIRTATEPDVESLTFRSVTTNNAELQGMIPWTNPSFASGQDNELATISLAPGERSDQLVFDDFFFDIPLGARIVGVQLEITGASSDFVDLDEKQMQFLLDGSPVGNNLADKSVISHPWQEDLHSWNYGYEFSDWGMNLTYDQLNANDLGFALQLENDSTNDSLNVSIENTTITIFYEPLFTVCGTECVVAYNDEVPNALTYNWTLNNGIGLHDVDTLDRVSNLDFSEADFGIIDVEIEIITPVDTFNCFREFLRENCSPSSIGDFVWFDANQNGLQDDDEVGVSGIELQLYTPLGELINSTTTNNSGLYSFDDVEGGYYYIEIAPGDFGLSPTITNDSLNSDFNTDFRTDVFFVAKGETINNIDAGLFDASSITGTIWSECDGNGTFNGDDELLEGIEIGIYQDNQLLSSVTTDSNGVYLFDDLAAGSFVIIIEDEDSFSSITGSNVFSENGNTTVTLAPGENKEFVDGAILKLSSYTFTIFIDDNGNGSYNSGEDDLDGTEVTLRDENESFTGIIENGTVSFTGLITTDYFLDVAGTEDLYIVESDVEASNNGGITLDLGSPDCGSTNQVQLVLTDYFASLGDFVWEDLDGNGLQDAGEPGISGVEVQLINFTTADIAATTVTDENGFYSFESPEPGSYIITIDVGEGYQETIVNVDDEKGSKISFVIDRFAMGPIDVTNGYVDNTWDAGFVFSTGMISGTAFLDMDENNIISDDDILVENVDVYLYLPGSPIQLVDFGLTDENGYYEFTAEPGDYFIGFSHPLFNQEVKFQVGSDPLIDSDVLENGDLETEVFTLAPADNKEGVNIGFKIQPGNVGNFVFLDANENGLFDNGESGIPGFDVKAYDLNGDLVAETITNIIGAYNISLDPGTYYLEFKKDKYENETIFNATDPNNNSDITNEFGPFTTGLITVGPGEIIDDIDAGFLPIPSIIGDLVWNDINGNGTQEFGEYGIGGVVVNLVKKGEGIVQTTTTGDGFDGVPGVYEFVVTSPGEYFVEYGVDNNGFSYTQYDNSGVGPYTDNGFATTPTFTVILGEEYKDKDAGVVSLQSIVGNFIWSDDNGNGIQDDDEQGLNGITVFLYDEFFNFIDVTISAYNVINKQDGYYYFDGLGEGDYILVFDTPDNFTIPNSTANITIDSDVTSEFIKGSTGIISLAEGEHDFHIDAGIFKSSNEPSDVGDFVWNDENEDGIQDPGEPGVGGVIINLIDVNGETVQSTTSKSDGSYQFDDVLNGFYRIQVPEPDDWDFTAANNSFDDETDSDIQSDGNSLLFFVNADDKMLTLDVGLISEDGVVGDEDQTDLTGVTHDEDDDTSFDQEERIIGQSFTEQEKAIDIKKVLEVYPIPAREKINLKINVANIQTARIEIVSGEGQVINTIFRDNIVGVAHDIEVNDLLPGFYFIKVTEGKEVYFKKFVIQ